MIKKILGLVVMVGAISMPGRLLAADLVTGATITYVAADHVQTGLTSYFLTVGVSGGTGPCANTQVRFKLANVLPEAQQRVVSLVLAAYLAGKPVRFSNANGTACDDATYIQLQ